MPFLLQISQETMQGAPLVAKIGKRSNGCPHWSPVEACGDNFIKFKLLNAILVQFVDCHVCIMIYYGIAIHKLV